MRRNPSLVTLRVQRHRALSTFLSEGVSIFPFMRVLGWLTDRSQDCLTSRKSCVTINVVAEKATGRLMDID